MLKFFDVMNNNDYFKKGVSNEKTFQWFEKITLKVNKAIIKILIFDMIIAFLGSLFRIKISSFLTQGYK